MVGFACIELTYWRRKYLFERHDFFIAQVFQRFVPLLDNNYINREALSVVEPSWENRDENWVPEFDDVGKLVDGVEDLGFSSHWELLHEVQQNFLLSSATTLFHGFEKQIRMWLVDEIVRWNRGENVQAAIWITSFGEILNLLKAIGFDVRLQEYFPDLDACRLVVNVHKHGRGPSLDEVQRKYPKFLVEAGPTDDTTNTEVHWQDHTHLRVTSDDLLQFASAVRRFWEEVPEEPLEFCADELPKWFLGAISA